MKSWRILTVLLLCLVLAGSISCNPFGEDEEEVTEQLVEVVRGDLTVTVSGSGNINVSKDARLAFGVGGKIDKIYVEEGDNVTKGEVLAKLETDALELALAQTQVALLQTKVGQAQAQVAWIQAQVASAQAQAARAQAQVALDAAEENLDKAEDLLERLKKFFHKSSSKVQDAESRFETTELQLEAAQAQLEAAQAQLEAAQAQLEAADLQFELTQAQFEVSELALAEAQKQLGETTIIAPFDSLVASVFVDEKDTVTTTLPIIYLIDTGNMELVVQMDEIDVTEVKPGQRAIIEVDALPAIPVEGKVSSISLLPTEEAGVIVYDVKINFDIPEGTGLRAGMSATIDIIIAERSNVLLVPDRAIKQDSQGNLVVGVMVNGQIEERTVVTGISDGFQTEIVDGLEEGEVVERRAKSK